jgi:pyrroloquinoline quinone biosynthesis protein B
LVSINISLMKKILPFLILGLLFSCVQKKPEKVEVDAKKEIPNEPFLVVLGTVQDAGSPHPGCIKDCCEELFDNPDPKRKVVSLGIVDPENEKTFLFEATPDFTTQIKDLKNIAPFEAGEVPSGIFVSHAHIGHYTGLMYLGREALGTKNIPVYAMPKMKEFLENNGPWSQLVSLDNISIQEVYNDSIIQLTSNISVKPFLVPHRDEYSETVGYIIYGKNKKIAFIPDVDKWSRWDTSIVDIVKAVDYAFLDATFYDNKELKNRDMSEIPHPFVVESLELFEDLPPSEKSKIYFIHLNHTNPLLDKESEVYQKVLENHYNIAKNSQVIIF